MTTATATITYRKTKTGQWVAFGPADAIKPGHEVTVTKRDGSTKVEMIASVGKTFRVDGRTMVYGYFDRAEGARQVRRPRRSCITGGNCSSFGSGRSCGGWDCDGY